MAIELTQELQELAELAVTDGRAPSVEAALKAGLELLLAFAADTADDPPGLGEAIREGMDDVTAGRHAPLDVQATLKRVQRQRRPGRE